MNRSLIAVFILIATGVSHAAATTQPAAKSELKTNTDRISYAIGIQLGKSFQRDDLAVNPTILVQAITDVLNDKPLAMTDEQIKQVMTDLQTAMRAKRKEMQAKMMAKRKTMGDKQLAEGKTFLADNAKKKGVTVLKSGLQYKVLNAGTGATPKATDKVKTHYRGTLINGKEFDSSYRRDKPAEFPVKGVIAGWTEALQLMKEGGKWQLFVPANLAYGERGAGDIPPNAALIFEVELIEIVK